MPIAQYRIFDAQGFVAKVDFALPELRIAIEYDGLWHGERRAFLDDRRRLNRLVAAGWIVLHVTVEDLQRPEQLLARLRALIARRYSARGGSGGAASGLGAGVRGGGR